jgi:hypothetical protein
MITGTRDSGKCFHHRGLPVPKWDGGGQMAALQAAGGWEIVLW